jgi:hypothetical protein
MIKISFVNILLGLIFLSVFVPCRGVDSFSKLRARRTSISVADLRIDLMSLPDLVEAKKTQSDKDWPMLRRLVEVNYFANRENPTREQISFGFSNSGHQKC